MKRVVLLTILLLLGFSALSQSKITSYKCNGYTYSVYAYYSGKELVTLVEGHCDNSITTPCYLVLKDERSLDAFIKCLTSIKEKYLEWKHVAKQNGVKDYSKDIPVSYPQMFVCGTKGLSQNERDYHEVNKKFVTGAEFRVGRDGDSFVRLKMRSDWEEYGGKYSPSLTWVISLKTASQFDSLIKALDKKKLKEKATVKTDLLFK